jgi:subtilisin family serine protease
VSFDQEPDMSGEDQPDEETRGGARPGRKARDEAGAEAPAAAAPTGYTFSVRDDVSADLDPQLQKLILKRRAGEELNPALVDDSPDGPLQVDVLAVLHDPSKPVPGLTIGRVIGDVVTGTCEIDRIEEVRRDPNVVSLKGARGVTPTLAFSVPEIRADRETLRRELPAGTRDVDGSGVIVGVVDFGCDIAHRNFRRADGDTRLLFLWDQRGPQTSMSPAGFPYGREFTTARINTALRSANPYQNLAYDPGQGAHGTHVMDIAAGNGGGSGTPGVAPQADLVFVQLATESLDSSSTSFGNSRRLLEAVDYIFSKAEELGRQAVVNLSLGTHGGPHDGSTPAERGFDHLVGTDGRAIVISAGNSHQRRSHAQGHLTPEQSRTLRWEKFQGDTTANECEVWYDGAGRLEVSLVFPDGSRLGPVRPGQTATIEQNAEQVGQLIHRIGDPLNGDNQIDILIGQALPHGLWSIELHATGTEPVQYHAWIERDDDQRIPAGIIPNQSRFIAADSDATHTVGSISCGRATIVVGSYSATVDGRDLSTFTAAGPTRDGRRKPEVSAPGDRIQAASSRSNDGTVTMSGTSMAAPHVTGLVALGMQAAGRTLTTTEIREAVIGHVRRHPPSGGDWHPRYGNGRVDAAATARSVVQPPVLAVSTLASAQYAPTEDGAPYASTISGLLSSLAGRASSGRVRLRLEVEIEP